MSRMGQDLRTALQMVRGYEDTQPINPKELLRLVPYVSGQWKRGLAVIIMIVIVALLSTPGPYLAKYIIDTVVVARDIRLLNIVVAAIIGLQAMRLVVSFLLNYSLTLLNQEVLVSVKGAIFERLLKLPFSFYDKAQTGYLMSRVREVDALSAFFSIVVLRLLTGVLEFTFALIVMFILEWRLALIALSVIPILYFVAQHYSRGIRVTSRNLLERSAELSRDLQEALSGIGVVKAFGTEEREASRFHQSLRRVLSSGMTQSVISLVSIEFLGLIIAVGGAMLLWVNGMWIIQDRITVGLYIAFAGYFAKLSGPIMMFASTGLTIQPAMVAMQRALDLLDIATEEEDPARRVGIERISGPIILDRVSFSYDREKEVLHEVSLRINAGERVALVGPSGSGKSTIIRLLMGLYRPTKGQISIDGHDINTLILSDLRERFTVVSQNVFLFNDSIRNNILYSNPEATEGMLIEAAKMADAHDFIMELPQGYDTMVGERGVRLSGGQVQRIALARALLKQADIVVLDEATSEVDFISERKIQGALAQLLRGKTCIVISHRPSAVAIADRTIWLEAGSCKLENEPDSLS